MSILTRILYLALILILYEDFTEIFNYILVAFLSFCFVLGIIRLVILFILAYNFSHCLVTVELFLYTSGITVHHVITLLNV